MAGMRSAPAYGLRPSRRWLRWWAVLVAVGVLAAAGCGGGSSVPRRPPAPPALFGTTWESCAPQGHPGQCRTVWVPQDWAHPHGPKIPLLVAVLPATATTHPAAPLFILAGWGGSAIGDVDWAVQAFGRLNQSMDLVFAVQRGTQYSWPQTCPGLMQTGPGLRAAIDRCLASVNRNPRHDTTAAAARDLDQVRKALGYNKINLYGASYGVSIGLAYLQRYGAHVRTAVFYSGSLLDVPLWQLTPAPRPAGLRPTGPPLRGRPGLRPGLPPGRRPGHRGQPATCPPGPGHHHRPHGKKQTITITLTAFLNAVIDAYLSSPDTAVLLPADLHAFAHGQWAKVINERGLASRGRSRAHPAAANHHPLRRRLGRDEPREDRPASPAVPVHPADGRHGRLGAATMRDLAARPGSIRSGAQQRPGRVRQRHRRPGRPASQRRGRAANHAQRPAGHGPRRVA